MKRTLNLVDWTMLASLVLGTALVVMAIASAGNLDTTTILVNGSPIDLDHLDAGVSAIAVGGVAVGLLVVALLVPLAVLIPLALVAVALIAVLLVLAGALAMVCSPLIFVEGVIWLAVQMIRRRDAPGRFETAAAASARIA